MEFYLEHPLGNLEEKQEQDSILPQLFASESDYMPIHHQYLSFRGEAISLISQFPCNFDRIVSYLAVNYLDRFLSKHEIDEIEGSNFEAQNVGRMELLILGALKWRMRSITPFAFLHFFITLLEIDLKIKDPSFRQSLKQRASQIIFDVQYDIKFLGIKPSVVAGSAIISASNELFPLKYLAVRVSITGSGCVEQEAVTRCFNLMQARERIQELERANKRRKT